MKKIFSLLVLFFAFSFTMSAQEKEENPQVQAKQDVLKMSQLLKLDDTLKENLYYLFEMKYTTLADRTLSVERKKELSKVVEAKLRATLTGQQMTSLEAEKELYTHIIN